MSQYAIISVGYTHSGKTSFAKKLMKEIPGVVSLERDPIASMLNNNFPGLSNDFLSFEKLKNNILTLITDEILQANEVIPFFSTCNARKEYRIKHVEDIKKKVPGIKIIMIYFDINQTILEDRITNSTKDTSVLSVSNNFCESWERQKTIFNIPSTDEADYFLVIKDNKNSDEVINEVREITSGK